MGSVFRGLPGLPTISLNAGLELDVSADWRGREGLVS